MTRTTFILSSAVLTVAFLTSGVGIQAQSGKAQVVTDKAQIARARRAIEAAYRAGDRTFERHDIKGLSAYDAPGCVNIGKDGKPIDQEKSHKNLREFFDSARSTAVKTQIVQFVLQSDGAVVTTEQHLVMFIVRPAGSGTLVGEGTSRDFWIKTPKGWRQKRGRVLDSTVSINGHVLPE